MSEAAQKKEPQTVAPQTASEGNKPKLDVLGLVVFVLVLTNVALVGGLGFYLQKLWERVQELQAQTQRLEAKDTHKESSVGKEMSPAPMGTLYPLEAFLVNVASDQGPRFLQTQMELELADPAVEEEVTRKKAALRDAIIVLLSSRSFSELREAAGLKKLRTDLLRTINNLLSSGKVREIYFTQFHFN